MAIQMITHIGVCVSNPEASRRFYRDGLGFKELTQLEVSNEASNQLMSLEGAVLRACFLERDGVRIELLHFPTGHLEGERPRPFNRLGLTHFAVRCDDLDATIAALERVGAQVVEGSRMHNPDFQAHCAIVMDPDGTRVELIEAPGDPAAPLGSPIE